MPEPGGPVDEAPCPLQWCDGQLHYVQDHPERDRYQVFSYRCSECRHGGHVAVDVRRGQVEQKGGPLFEPFRYHRLSTDGGAHVDADPDWDPDLTDYLE